MSKCNHLRKKKRTGFKRESKDISATNALHQPTLLQGKGKIRNTTTTLTNTFWLASFTNVADDNQTISIVGVNIKRTNDEIDHPEVAENNLSSIKKK